MEDPMCTQRDSFYAALVTGASAFDVLVPKEHQIDNRLIIVPLQVVEEAAEVVIVVPKKTHLPGHGKWMN
jgi:hypothetical protein